MMDAEEGISDEDRLENEEDNISEIHYQIMNNDTTTQTKKLQEEMNTVAADTIHKLIKRIQYKYIPKKRAHNLQHVQMTYYGITQHMET